VRLWEWLKSDFIVANEAILDDLTLAEEWLRQAEEEGRRRLTTGKVNILISRVGHRKVWRSCLMIE
jgi:hypothetical protein